MEGFTGCSPLEFCLECFIHNDQESFVFLVLKAQANLSVQALGERLKKLEEKSESNSVDLALQGLHRTLDKTRFDPEDVIFGSGVLGKGGEDQQSR